MASYLAFLSVLCSLTGLANAYDIRPLSVDATQGLLQKWGLEKEFGKSVKSKIKSRIVVHKLLRAMQILCHAN